ncbi:MAG TPA: beta-propeller fold lactonase family protein [Xanthobacteraceae bacterium]|nr:beta-propeller fold lactonase family protein [Xanthobacteraceae bacterium]
MIDRRAFATLLAGACAAPGLAWGEDLKGKTVLYASIGPVLTLFDLDGDALVKRNSVTLPANVQYAWPHPSRKYFYVVSSNGGPGAAGDKHFASALRIDPASGALSPHGQPQMLSARPIHTSVDQAGRFLLIAYNDPSSLTVHHINTDGTIGEPVPQPNKLDTGIYAHQIRAVPSNQMVTLVTRGNNAEAGKPEDPGAIKTFSFKDGILTGLASIAPGNGLGFGPRHLDFHPTKPWVFVSIERQSKLYVYTLDDATGLSREPLFIKTTLSDPKTKFPQGAGPIHVHPNGRFVYQTNRASALTAFDGQKVFAGGENSVAVFAIDQTTGEPTLIQNIDGRGVQLRTFGIDPSGSKLVAASVAPIQVREGFRVGTLTAGLMVYRVGSDGRLDFARKYDVEATSQNQQFWSGMVTLA